VSGTPEERLFNLVLALIASSTGLTKTEIFATVQGYSDGYTVGMEMSALDRMFERDKKALRDAGVPLETHERPEDLGDNHLTRYLISASEYRLPEGVEFSSQDLQLLALAASVWRDGSMSIQSRRALFKLRSLGVDVEEPLIGVAPSIRVREAAFDALQAAVGQSEVRFPYLKPGDAAPRTRHVRPLALVRFDDNWHLYSWDLEAKAARNFLLSRIVGPVRTAAAFTDDSGRDHRHLALAELENLWARRTALLEVRAGSHAAGRLATVRDTERSPEGHWRVHYLDTELFADELAGYGPEIVVLEPADLRAAVIARLAKTLELHTGVSGG